MIDLQLNFDRLSIREEARTIAKAATVKTTRRARPSPKTPTPLPPPLPREPRTHDINKSIAIAVDPDMRARVETIWHRHNELSPVPASKSAIYRAVLQQGVKRFEEELQIKPAATG